MDYDKLIKHKLKKHSQMAEEITYLCGNEISETCKGANIPMNEAGFQILVSEAVNAGTFALGAAA